MSKKNTFIDIIWDETLRIVTNLLKFKLLYLILSYLILKKGYLINNDHANFLNLIKCG